MGCEMLLRMVKMNMKLLGVLIVIANCCLCFGGSMKLDVHELGDDGIVSISSLSGVFDFSKNGRYVWLTETNCYDLTGRRTELGALDESSFPLARMKWKRCFLGDGGRYSLSKIQTNIHTDAVRSVAMECLSAKEGDGDWVCKSSLTSYAESGPLITVVVRSCSRNKHYMIAARVGANGKIEYGERRAYPACQGIYLYPGQPGDAGPSGISSGSLYRGSDRLCVGAA